jgi:hypothetical protein
MEEEGAMGELSGMAEVAVRTCLGLVFLAAAGSKVRRRADWRAFRASVGTLLSVPMRGAATGAAAAVVMLELAIPLLVSAPRSAPAGLGVAICLLAVFTATVIAARVRGIRTPCRCFGPSAAPPGARQAVRNVVLLTLAVSGLAAGAGQHGSGMTATVVGVSLGLICAVIFMALDDLLDLLAGRPAPEVVHE